MTLDKHGLQPARGGDDNVTMIMGMFFGELAMIIKVMVVVKVEIMITMMIQFHRPC